MTELVQATAGSKLMTPQDLAEELRRAGKPLERIRMPGDTRYETKIEKRKRLGGLLGAKSVSKNVPVRTTEEIAVWPIHPLDFFDHDDLFRRYLTPDGCVYEHDLDD